MSPAWEDLDQFTDADDFGVWATVHFQAGGTKRLAVLFDEPAAGIRNELRLPRAPNVSLGDYDADMQQPRITAAAGRLACVSKRDCIWIELPEGRRKFAALGGPKLDGNGMAYIPLAEQT